MLQDIYLKKLYLKAKRRGTLELDLVLGYIADNFLHTMNNTELKSFENLLNEDEALIMKWINKQEDYPDEYKKIFIWIDDRQKYN